MGRRNLGRIFAKDHWEESELFFLMWSSTFVRPVFTTVDLNVKH